MVSSRKNMWLYCPLVPEASIKLSVLPAGMKFRFSHEPSIFMIYLETDQKIKQNLFLYMFTIMYEIK